MQTNLKDWCIENSREDLLEQWDYENNLTLIPEQCTPGMGRKCFGNVVQDTNGKLPFMREQED